MGSESARPRVERIVIVGAGGHGAVVADILQRQQEAGDAVIPVGFVDDTPELAGADILGLRVLAPIRSLSTIPHDSVIVAVGDNFARRLISETLQAGGERLATAIHPHSSIASSASIGEGSMICAGAIVTARASIGRGAIVNTKASVDHDSVVGDFSHVSAGATVGARVHLGAEVLIALGASVVSNMTVGDRSTIGAGAVVVSPIPADVVAFGVPARVRPARKG